MSFFLSWPVQRCNFFNSPCTSSHLCIKQYHIDVPYLEEKSFFSSLSPRLKLRAMHHRFILYILLYPSTWRSILPFLATTCFFFPIIHVFIIRGASWLVRPLLKLSLFNQMYNYYSRKRITMNFHEDIFPPSFLPSFTY